MRLYKRTHLYYDGFRCQLDFLLQVFTGWLSKLGPWLRTEMKKGKRSSKLWLVCCHFFYFSTLLSFYNMVLLRFPGGSHLVRILQKFWSRQDQKTGERQIFSKRSQLSIDKSLIVTFYVSFEETAIFAHLAIALFIL